jgi:hypothetical protein
MTASALALEVPACASLVTAILPPPSVDRAGFWADFGRLVEVVPRLCYNQCRPALAARLNEAVQVCAGAWQGTSITLADLTVSKDNVPSLLLETGTALRGLFLDLLQVMICTYSLFNCEYGPVWALGATPTLFLTVCG